MDRIEFSVSLDEAPLRMDLLLSKRFIEKSRTYFQFLIENGAVLVNGKPVKKREMVQEGDKISVCFKELPQHSVTPEKIDLEILYEDAHLLAVNKPPGMVTHPAVGNWSGTFVNALLGHCEELSTGSDPLRPGIVHRLDKDTTGLILAAKTTQAHQKLIEAFSSRQIEKRYLAICHGRPKEGVLKANIGRHPLKRKEMTVLENKGKEAITTFKPLKHNEHFCLVEAIPLTGRTHQIRVHLKHLGCPILGDPIYGNKKGERLFLHAHRLKFNHPITKESVELEAPLPEDFQRYISKLE